MIREVKRTFIEFILIASVGLIFGLAANAVNNDGVTLSRNYIQKLPATKPESQPATAEAPLARVNKTGGISTGEEANNTATGNLVAGYLPDSKVQIISHENMVATFNDPLYANNLFVIIDARNEELYQEGHVPGAYQLDWWRIEKYDKLYLQEVLDICYAAERIIVYCEGGECVDSEQIAQNYLIANGIEPSRVFVYKGGMEGWIKNKSKVETGAQHSGVIAEGKP